VNAEQELSTDFIQTLLDESRLIGKRIRWEVYDEPYKATGPITCAAWDADNDSIAYGFFPSGKVGQLFVTSPGSLSWCIETIRALRAENNRLRISREQMRAALWGKCLDWDVVPEGWDYWAVDEDGQSYAYKHEPRLGCRFWEANDMCGAWYGASVPLGVMGLDWRESLRKRPETQP